MTYLKKAISVAKSGFILYGVRFSFAVYIIEFILMILLFMKVQEHSRFQGVFSFENFLLALLALDFLFRALLIHLIFGFILEFLLYAGKVRFRFLYCLTFVLTAYLFLAIKYPQVYDEFPLFSRGLRSIRLFDFPWIRYVPVGVTLALSLLSLSEIKKSKKAILVFLIGQILVTLFFSQSLRLEATPVVFQNPPQKVKNKPDVILVVVDSLRHDFALEKTESINESLKLYLSTQSKKLELISPLAQTHGALTSLLTGKTPIETGIRTNLSESGLNTDEIYSGSILENFIDLGYKIKIIRDNAEYAWIDTGKIPSVVYAPDSSFANLVMSTIYKNRLIYGFFNNWLGFSVLPELKNNAAFTFSYDLGRFAQKTIDVLSESISDSSPNLILIHTCAMHWPGAWPYPYYPKGVNPKTSRAPFSYTRKFQGFQESMMSPDQWKEQVAFNSAVYSSGVNHAVKDFLNPVFEFIEKTHYAENAVIALMSDHGEDLWTDKNPFPKQRPVQHGTSLLFGASSERSFFRISAPQNQNVETESRLSLTEILPSILEWVKNENANLKAPLNWKTKSEIKYSETGLWPLSSFNGQFLSVPAVDLGPLLKVDPGSRRIYINKNKLSGIVIQKQRALYWKNYRYTLFPTQHGWNDFLCDQQTDPACLVNLDKSDPKALMIFRKEISKYLAPDFENGNLVTGPCSPLGPLKSLGEVKNIELHQWVYYFNALDCINGSFDFEPGFNLLNELWDFKTSRTLRTVIESQAIDWCTNSKLFTRENLPDFIKKMAITWKTSLDENAEKVTPSRIRCLGDIGFLTSEQVGNALISRNSFSKNNNQKHIRTSEYQLEKILAIDTILKNESMAAVDLIKEFKKILDVEISYGMVEEIEPYLMHFLNFSGRYRNQDKGKFLYILCFFLNESKMISVLTYNWIQWEIKSIFEEHKYTPSPSLSQIETNVEYRFTFYEKRRKMKELRSQALGFCKKQGLNCG